MIKTRCLVKFLGILATALAVFFCAPSTAMEIEVQYSDNRPIFRPALWVELTGEIKTGDTIRFLTVILPFMDRDVEEIVFRFDSPGGNLVEGLRLGRAISELPFITRAYVGVNGGENICASACVNAYLGSDYRFLDEGSRIGVHQFAVSGTEMETNEALSISQDISAQIVEHIRAMRADPSFFGLMVSAHAEEVYWVPRETLEELRVVTGNVYDQTAEYRNVNGTLALHLSQVSQVGKNSLTLTCGERGLVGIFDFHKPEAALLDQLELYVDGTTIPLGDFEPFERDEYRVMAISLLPEGVTRRLASAAELGARISAPEAGVFFGFFEGIRDKKISETARGCLASLQAAQPEMTRVDGVDFIGGDLTQTGYRNVSFIECQRICDSDRRCVAVSYVVSQQWCWPKDKMLKVDPKPGVISAYFE